jgi:hypothetical protein
LQRVVMAGVNVVSISDSFTILLSGASSITHSWRTPPLVLLPGTSLQVSMFPAPPLGFAALRITGILSSDYNAAVR